MLLTLRERNKERKATKPGVARSVALERAIGEEEKSREAFDAVLRSSTGVIDSIKLGKHYCAPTLGKESGNQSKIFHQCGAARTPWCISEQEHILVGS